MVTGMVTQKRLAQSVSVYGEVLPRREPSRISCDCDGVDRDLADFARHVNAAHGIMRVNIQYSIDGRVRVFEERPPHIF